MLKVVDLRGWGDPPKPAALALDPSVVDAVRGIVRRVRDEGDRALVELTSTHDRAEVEGRIRVADDEIDAASDALAPDLRDALASMADRLRDLHARQLPAEWETQRDGVRYGEVVRPLASAGCYVPGGLAAYPSTVLMTAIPAAVAGVERIMVCTPPAPDGSVPSTVLHAARLAGVESVFRVGGAQAVAAMAYGTESVPAVDKIVGPGNVWVTAAKREVAGIVGIDALAGPTELVVVTDETTDPEVLAADLVAQAEHAPDARAFVVSLDENVVRRVQEPLDRAIESSPRIDVVNAALAEASVLLVTSPEHAAAVVNSLAPEHLQVLTTDPRWVLNRVRSFGAAFLGPHTAVSFGDYGVGSNHVLPTMSTARFASGLRAADFVTVSSVVEASAEAVARFGPEIERVAVAEHLPGHARASEVRR